MVGELDLLRSARRTKNQVRVPLRSKNVRRVKKAVMSLMTGTLVVIHGNVLHKSEANRSNKSRYIYTFHVIEGANTYDDKNWYLSHIFRLTQASTNISRLHKSLFIVRFHQCLAKIEQMMCSIPQLKSRDSIFTLSANTHSLRTPTLLHLHCPGRPS